MPSGSGGLDANGIYLFGEDDTQGLFSDLLNLLGESVSDKVAALVATRATFHTSDAGFPTTTVSSSTTQRIHNRITIPSATFKRSVLVTATMHLTHAGGGQVDALLYRDAVSIDQVRPTLAVGVLTPVKMTGQFELAAGAGVVVEARFNRITGTGDVTPSVSSLSRMIVTTTPEV